VHVLPLDPGGKPNVDTEAIILTPEAEAAAQSDINQVLRVSSLHFIGQLGRKQTVLCCLICIFLTIAIVNLNFLFHDTFFIRFEWAAALAVESCSSPSPMAPKYMCMPAMRSRCRLSS
jgi:hypothetical protein